MTCYFPLRYSIPSFRLSCSTKTKPKDSDRVSQHATDILRSRFDESFHIKQERLYRFRSLPAVKSSSNVAGIRRVSDTLQSHVRRLKVLKVLTTSFSSMLTNILLRSLPPDIVMEYHRRRAITKLPFNTTGDEYASSSDRRLQDLIYFIQVEVQSREKF